MKQVTRALLLITLVISMLVMTACGAGDVQDIIDSNTKTPLSVPTNLRVDEQNALLLWNSVEYAIGYTVLVNETTYLTNTNAFSLHNLKDGEYTISVMANGDGIMYTSSPYSYTISYTRKDSSGNQYADDVIAAFKEFDEINTKNSFLGYGIHLINASAITSKNVLMNYPIFDMDKLLDENLLKSNEHYNTFESIEADTIEAFSQNMSTSTSITSGSNVSAKGNIYGADVSVSASLTNGLATSFTKTSSMVESQYFLEVIAENQSYWLILQTSEQRYKELLSEEFKADLYNSSITPAQLFEKYGTHMLTSVAMGGNICMYYTLYSYAKGVSTTQYAEVSSALKSNVEAAYGGYSAGAGSEQSFASTFTYKTLASQYGIQIDKKIVSAGGGSFGINSEETLYANYYDWQKSLDTYPVVIGIKDANSLYPIWNLLDMNVEGAEERYQELYTYFQTYGAESYSNLCEAYGITPSVAPTDITNISVGDYVNYSENQVVNVKSGQSLQISFDVEPYNATKYLKTYIVDNPAYASVDDTGLLTISPTTPGGAYIKVTVTAGSISRQITFYVINTFNVTFNTRVTGLNVDPLYGILEGYMIEAPQVEREGYILEGWYTDTANTNKFDFEVDCVTSHMTLYAKWVAIKPIVTFDTGEGSSIDSQTVAYKGSVTKPKNPTRTGYVFGGWYEDEEFTLLFDFATALIQDVTLYAKWDKIEYTVTFESNGGTPIAEMTTSITEGYQIQEISPSKSYYHFDGWYLDSYFTQKFYFETEITKDITLYAKWTPVQAQVILVDTDGASALYDIFGNEIQALATDIDHSFKVTAPIPYKEGYTFVGWYLNGVQIDLANYAEFKPKAEPYKVVALWSINSYRLTYILDGELYDADTYQYGERIELPTVEVVGHSFSGWKWGNKELPTTMPAQDVELKGSLIVLNYTVTYYVDGVFHKAETYAYGADIYYAAEPTETGKSFSGWMYSGGALPTTMPAENIRIDGGFNIVQRTVFYYIDGVFDKKVIVNWTHEIPEYIPEKTGYTFSGWTMEDGSAMPETMPNSDIYLYGSFGINSYTMTFKTVGGNVVTAITAPYGAVIAAPAAPVREGYTFVGWDKEIPSTMPAEDIVLTASWKINIYTITFNTNGGTFVAPIRAAYDTPISIPVNPTKVGHDFGGWDQEIPVTMPAGDITINAKWNVHVRTLTFVSNGTVVAKITGNYGSSVAAPTTPTRVGYRFDGWDKTIPATMPDENITFTAKWTLYSSKITYNINSSTTVNNESTKGSFSMSGSVGTISYNVTQLNDADATTYAKYYTFIGWFTAASGGVQITDENGKLLKNVSGYTNAEGKWIRQSFDGITLYAQWRQTIPGIYINNASGLTSIRNNPSKIYVLIDDINMNGASWTPISEFSGILNGDGHCVYNFYITKTGTGSADLGFIVKNKGTIQNLVIGKADVKTYDSTYSVKYSADYTESGAYSVLRFGGFAALNEGTVENCALVNVYIYARLADNDNDCCTETHVGGIAARNGGTISGCDVKSSYLYSDGASPKETGDNIDVFCGGICAYNTSKITKCSVIGSTIRIYVGGNGWLFNQVTSRGWIGEIAGAQSDSGNISSYTRSGNALKTSQTSDNYTSVTIKKGDVRGEGGTVS